jgi:serine/threonine protein kinase
MVRLVVKNSSNGIANPADSFIVRRELGKGAQGTVYEVLLESGNSYAFKAYPEPETRQAFDISCRIKTLIDMGAPDSAFVWPLDWIDAVTETDAAAVSGYLMPLIDKSYHHLVALLSDEIDISLRDTLAIASRLTEAFDKLHLNGLCYRDISLGNIYLNNSRDILIGDIDNIEYDGSSKSGVLGTQSFMAPEIVRGEQPPSIYTDLYSLSVVLFYLFYRGHPLEGRREAEYTVLDDKAKDDLYGHNPLYIYNADDDRNRPINGIHSSVITYYGIMPACINSAFYKAFTTGLANSSARLVAADWNHIFVQANKALVECCRCGAENFHTSSYSSLTNLSCWNCGCCVQAPHSTPIEIQIDKIWPTILAELKSCLSRYTYDRQILTLRAEITRKKADSQSSHINLRIITQGHFQRTQIQEIYAPLIKNIVKKEFGAAVDIEIA